MWRMVYGTWSQGPCRGDGGGHLGRYLTLATGRYGASGSTTRLVGVTRKRALPGQPERCAAGREALGRIGWTEDVPGARSSWGMGLGGSR